jgi:hypothetical protein
MGFGFYIRRFFDIVDDNPFGFHSDMFKDQQKKARELLGGVCQVCGYKGRLEFHHLTYRNGNPTERYGLGAPSTMRTVQEVFKDPANFALLCRRCHTVVTSMTGLELYQIISLSKLVNQEDRYSRLGSVRKVILSFS